MDISRSIGIFLLVCLFAIFGASGQIIPTYPGYPEVYYNSSDCIFVKARNISDGVATYCPEYSGNQITGAQTTAQECISRACQYTAAVTNAINVITAQHCYIRKCSTPLTDDNLLLDSRLGGRDIWIRVIDYCSLNPCQNGATCNNKPPISYECICANGYTGPNCDTKLVICDAGNGTQSGCSQTSCAWDTNINICHYNHSSIVTSGTCVYVKIHPTSDGYASLCTGGLTAGSNVLPQCIEGACNHGIANVNALNYNQGSTCFYRKCDTSSSGVISDLKLTTAHGGRDVWIASIDHCQAVSCQNGATCLNSESTYYCICTAGYQGQLCENDINECLSNPCQNGATCENRINSYTCQCVSGYTDVNCQTEINECSSQPCQNGGQCQELVNKYSCQCATGFTGSNCETDTDECSSNPCTNGQCIDEVSGFTCDCNNTAYSGTLCDKDAGSDMNGANSQSQNNDNGSDDDSSGTAAAISVPVIVVTAMAGLLVSTGIYKWMKKKKADSKVNPYQEDPDGLANAPNPVSALGHQNTFYPAM